LCNEIFSFFSPLSRLGSEDEVNKTQKNVVWKQIALKVFFLPFPSPFIFASLFPLPFVNSQWGKRERKN
jgi:hypothetical protein